MKNEGPDLPALPPYRLPLYYFGFATLCFILALAGAVRYAQDLTQFYYHPRILAFTHLITLGWISGSILGALFLVGPMSLQLHLTVGRWDYFLYVLYVIGVLGMVAHFWMDRPAGMVWSAGCVYVVFLWMAIKVIPELKRARGPGFVKMHIIFAFLNVIIAGGWGILLGIHKAHGFLPTSAGPNVVSHAHIAALGWATMMVFGIGYRLLPMFIPGTPSSGKLPWVNCILLEIGMIGLFVSTLVARPWKFLFAVLLVLGIGIFLIAAFRTNLLRKPVPPPEPARPDFALLHVAASFLWLLLAAVSGLILLKVKATQWTLQLALAYGFMGLVGFLSQVVIGMKPKIFSILAWYYAFRRSGYSASIPRPVDMPVRAILFLSFVLWTLGVPLSISGILLGWRFPVSAGAIFLLAAVILSTFQDAVILRRIWR